MADDDDLLEAGRAHLTGAQSFDHLMDNKGIAVEVNEKAVSGVVAGAIADTVEVEGDIATLCGREDIGIVLILVWQIPIVPGISYAMQQNLDGLSRGRPLRAQGSDDLVGIDCI